MNTRYRQISGRGGTPEFSGKWTLNVTFWNPGGAIPASRGPSLGGKDGRQVAEVQQAAALKYKERLTGSQELRVPPRRGRTAACNVNARWVGRTSMT